MTTKQTIKSTNERIDELVAGMEKLTSIVDKLATAQLNAAAPAKQETPKPPKQKPFIAPCPDYATAAQRIEYDKLAKRANELRKDVAKVMGTDSVRAFIPVSREQAKMPHTIQWTASYSK